MYYIVLILSVDSFIFGVKYTISIYVIMRYSIKPSLKKIIEGYILSTGISELDISDIIVISKKYHIPVQRIRDYLSHNIKDDE